MMTDGCGISVIIPVYEEAGTLEDLFSQLLQVLESTAQSWEILFIDDGSEDDSFSVLEQIRKEAPEQVHVIRFRKNFGKAAALDAGFRAARGELIFTLDADLQDDPIEIPHFIEKMKQGYGMVSGWKQNRQDPWHKTFPSKIFNTVTSVMTGVPLHDMSCGFKCYRQETAKSLRVYGDLHRFIPVLVHHQGYRVTEIPVRHHPRLKGHSKYGWRRFIHGFLDLLTILYLIHFRSRPMHLFGSLAILITIFGALPVGLVLLGLGFLAEHQVFVNTKRDTDLVFYTVDQVLSWRDDLLGSSMKHDS